jgi:hypothetical protein
MTLVLLRSQAGARLLAPALTGITTINSGSVA